MWRVDESEKEERFSLGMIKYQADSAFRGGSQVRHLRAASLRLLSKHPRFLRCAERRGTPLETHAALASTCMSS